MLSAQTDTDEHNKTLPHTATFFDTIIVFGEGPVKPVLFKEELTPEQKEKWQNFQKDPLHTREPSFWVVSEKSQTDILATINRSRHLTSEQKFHLREYKRMEWQRCGNFALKRWGRQNALAAGLALYTGMTDKLILSGGRTISQWAKKSLTKEHVEKWPSEALLMKDVIKRSFARLYFEEYGRAIDDAIVLEDNSTNTLENFAYTLNKNPQLLRQESRIGLLTAGHHLKRVLLLAQLFGVKGAEHGGICAQEILDQVANDMGSDKYKQVLYSMQASEVKEEVSELLSKEERWIRGLKDPKYVTYWCGYMAEVKHPRALQRFVNKLKDPSWFCAIQEVLSTFGLNAREFQNVDLAYLSKNDPEKYYLFIESLRKCKSPEYRKFPPVVSL